MTDPIADLLARIRNAQLSNQTELMVPYSKLKYAIVQLLEREGWVTGIAVLDNQQQIKVLLKYDQGQPIIHSLKRVSKPGRRVYANRHTLPRVMNGLGMAIISTSKGLMTNTEARKQKLGGEVVCEIF